MPKIREPIPATEVVWDLHGINLVPGVRPTTPVDPPRVIVTLYNVTAPAQRKEVRYSAEEAQVVLDYVNTGNFTVVTLYRRVMDRLLADGHLSGTVEEDPII